MWRLAPSAVAVVCAVPALTMLSGCLAPVRVGDTDVVDILNDTDHFITVRPCDDNHCRSLAPTDEAGRLNPGQTFQVNSDTGGIPQPYRIETKNGDRRCLVFSTTITTVQSQNSKRIARVSQASDCQADSHLDLS